MSQFSGSDEEGKKRGISSEALPLFGIVWTSSQILSHLMLETDLRGKRILEAGCGMALASHLLNSLGADITALDIHPVTADLLSRNVELNKGKPIPFINASWSNDIADLGEFDLIVGSDILYEPKHAKTLVSFIRKHIKSTGDVIIVDPDRGQLEAFREGMSQQGFSYENLKTEFRGGQQITFSGVADRFSFRSI